MTTKRTRLGRDRHGDINETTLWRLSDGLYAAPESPDAWDGFNSEAVDAGIWKRIRVELVLDWIEEFPGTRPSEWWLRDAPERSRRRIGGTGDPAFQHLGYVEKYYLGIPTIFVSEFDTEYYNGKALHEDGSRIGTEHRPGSFTGRAIDPLNPPLYESQGTYLARHGLLSPAENKRLTPESFEPEAVAPVVNPYFS